MPWLRFGEDLSKAWLEHREGVLTIQRPSRIFTRVRNKNMSIRMIFLNKLPTGGPRHLCSK